MLLEQILRCSDVFDIFNWTSSFEPSQERKATNVQVAIIGAGAVGKWLAGIHMQAGVKTGLICKNSQQAKAVQQSGIQVMDTVSGRTNEYPVDCIAWEHVTAATVAAVKVWIVSVKTYQWPVFYELWSRNVEPFLQASPLVVAVHNGFVDYRQVSPKIAARRIIRSVLTYGVTAEEARSVQIRGNGVWTLEQPSDLHDSQTFQNWVEAIKPRVNITVTSDIDSAIWRKLLVNSCVNPVTALAKLENGVAWENPHAHPMMVALAKEAQEVSRLKYGMELVELLPYIQQVCTDTYYNRSSMLQDLLAGRKTEIDALNGRILQLAKEYGLKAMHHQIMYDLIKAQE
ncbi:2-dehydropantoate 2-reductase [Fodinisporobacter ferrooxydans]|uniref:2-dehydropantoate 2-reductase n=1 Tax=Fodinisporobacter ferrooxydans TaxID=2901836 RepID=A0ABY4CF46_9BACL|nr:2-dehydropantoate 2-reductase [Alicyclobacillaceae bacterium MYW30-H2]